MEHLSTPKANEAEKTQNKMFGFSNAIGAALLGGLFAMVYVMYKNYVAAGMKDVADKVLKIGLPVTIVVHGILFYLILLTETKLPIGLGIISAVIVSFSQNSLIKAHEENSGLFYGLWKSLGVVVLGVASSLVTLLIFFLIFHSQLPILQLNSNKEIRLNAGDGSGWQTYKIDQFSQRVTPSGFIRPEMESTGIHILIQNIYLRLVIPKMSLCMDPLQIKMMTVQSLSHRAMEE